LQGRQPLPPGGHRGRRRAFPCGESRAGILAGETDGDPDIGLSIGDAQAHAIRVGNHELDGGHYAAGENLPFVVTG
jgi:hypothetical protein